MRAGIWVTLALLLSGAALAEPRPVVIGTSAPFPPFQMRDADGQMIGLEPELLAAICARGGWTCSWQELEFADIFDALEDGRIDLAASGLGWTEARNMRGHMTCPYRHTPPQTGTFFVTDASHDPKSGRIAVAADTLYADALAAAGLPMRLFTDEDHALAALQSGEIAAYFGALSYVLRSVTPPRPLPVDQMPISSDGTSLAVSRTDPALGAEIDTYLAEMSRDGTLEVIVKKWTGLAQPDPVARCASPIPTS